MEVLMEENEKLEIIWSKLQILYEQMVGDLMNVFSKKR